MDIFLDFSSKYDKLMDSLQKLYSIEERFESITEYKKADWTIKDAVERNIQKAIEIIIDMGKMLISQRNYRVPESNYDVFEILAEKNDFPTEYFPIIKKMIGTRNKIIHDYEKVDEEVLFAIVKRHLKDIEQIASILYKKAQEISNK